MSGRWLVGVACAAALVAVVLRLRERRAASATVLERLRSAYRGMSRSHVRGMRSVDTGLLKPNNKDLARLGLKEGATWKEFRLAVDALRQASNDVRVVHLIRHGEGEHNKAERELGSEYWETVEALTDKYFDAPLNQVGMSQCAALAGHFARATENDFPEIDVVIVSPLTRAIQTAKHSLPHIWGKVPVFAVEMSRERHGKNKCDKRKSVSQLEKEFPEVNFDLFMESEHDEMWTERRETDEEISQRIAHFYSWLSHTPWQNIAIVGHSSYMASTVTYFGEPYHWPANCECATFVIKPVV